VLVVLPIDPLSALLLLLTGPLIPLFMALIGSSADALTRRQWTALSRMSAYFLDVIQGLGMLKTLGSSREQAHTLTLVSERFRTATMACCGLPFSS
jgi:ATP-binding cassette subfamily C protein CydD